jgi:outer membrane receptor for ferrienterochelin and colicin
VALTLAAGACAGLPADASDAGEEPPAADAAPAAAEPPAANVTSVTQAIPADAGISVQTLCTNCNNADLSVGGLGNEHVSVVCDGVPVPSGLGQIYLLSVMPPTMIDKVAVSKGAGEAKLQGGAVGGGIEIERRPPQANLLVNASADSGDYGWNATRLDLSGKSGPVGGYFVVSSSESDSVDEDGDGFANLPSFDRYTLDGGLRFEPGENHRFRVGATRYDEDQLDGPAAVDFTQVGFPFPQFQFNGYNREDVQLRRDQVESVYEWDAGNGATLSILGAWADREQDVQETETVEATCQNFYTGAQQRLCPSYFIDEAGGHAAATWSQPIGQQARVRAGTSWEDSEFEVIDVRYNQIQFESLGQQGVEFDKYFELKEDVTERGLWAEGETGLGSRFDLSVGLRWVSYDYGDNEAERYEATHDPDEEWLAYALPEGDKLIPRAAVTWKPTDEMNLRLSAGLGYRAPAPAFDQVCCGRRYRGNRGLQVEESTSVGLEATFQPAPRYRVGGALFFTDFDDLILNMATQSEAYQHVYQNVNVTQARKISATVEGRVQAPAWMSTKLSFTWVDSENRDDTGLIVALIDQGSGPVVREFHYAGIPYSVEYRGAAGLDFRVPGAVNLSVNTQYTGPTPIQSFLFTDVAEDLTEVEDFWVVNFAVSKAFTAGMSVYAGVDNVFDYFQSDLGDPAYDYNWGPLRGRYVYGGVGLRYGASQ